jgi:hypothetical protein
VAGVIKAFVGVGGRSGRGSLRESEVEVEVMVGRREARQFINLPRIPSDGGCIAFP